MSRRPVITAAGLGLVVAVAMACSPDAAAPDSAANGTASVPGTGAFGSSASDPYTSSAPAADTDTATTEPGDGVLDTPAGIAGVLTAVERAIRDPSISPSDVASWGRTQQRVHQALARRPEWDGVVRALLPEDVVVGFDLIVEARRAVADHAARRAAERAPGETAPPPSPTLPAWTIAEPLPAEELRLLYRSAQDATGVPWAYLAAIHLVETRMGRIEGVSTAGAVGPMQFLPETWAACCVGDPFDPADAILGAAVYLVDLGAPADMLGALYGYNPNEGYVGAVDAYARLLLLDEQAYDGFHAWEVYVGSAAGTVRLPVGFSSTAPVDAARYLADHPQDVAPLPVERP